MRAKASRSDKRAARISNDRPAQCLARRSAIAERKTQEPRRHQEARHPHNRCDDGQDQLCQRHESFPFNGREAPVHAVTSEAEQRSVEKTGRRRGRWAEPRSPRWSRQPERSEEERGAREELGLGHAPLFGPTLRMVCPSFGYGTTAQKFSVLRFKPPLQISKPAMTAVKNQVL